MKRILLVSLLICNASLLDAMANPDVMLQASALLRRNLQIVDADVSIEHRDDGTFVHYLRNGQEMAVFNADLLKKSGVINDIIEDLGSSDETLIAIVKQLFDRLADIHQIKLAIQALGANNPTSEQDSIADSVKQFVNQLQPRDLAWLANWADEWAIEFVYNALMPKLASDKNVAFDLYNRGLINDVVAAYVSDKINMSDVYDSVLKRLVREIKPQLSNYCYDISSVVYRSQIFVRIGGRLMIYDLQGNLIQIITPQLQQGETIRSVAYNQDGLHILTAGIGGSLMIYDSQGNLIQVITPQLEQGERIRSVGYNQDGLHILVGSDRRLMTYDSQGSLIATIVPQLQQGEMIHSVVCPDGAQILLVRTSRRVMLYDLQGNLIATIVPQLQLGETFQSVVYSPGSQILIGTGWRIIIYGLQGNLIQVITPKLQSGYEAITSAKYNKDESQILIETRQRVMIYDLKGNLIQVITPQLQLDEFIQSAVYSPDGAQILVGTNRRVIMYPNINLTQLNLTQKQLLIKASEAWKVRESYVLDFDELETYNSLPLILKDKKLFYVSTKGCVIS